MAEGSGGAMEIQSQNLRPFHNLRQCLYPDSFLADPSASEQLLRLVYDELRQLVAAKLASEELGNTLQLTALVHEAYPRLVDEDNQLDCKNRRHFFGVAAEAMRRILIERARQKASIKRGGDLRRIDVDDNLIIDDRASDDLLGLDEAPTELESHDAEATQLVKLRYFAGHSRQDAAEAMQIGPSPRFLVHAECEIFQYLAFSKEGPGAMKRKRYSEE